MATVATFKTPQIQNEPNVCPLLRHDALSLPALTLSLQKHYAKGSPDREDLAAAIEALKSRLPLQVPVVVGGKHIVSAILRPKAVFAFLIRAERIILAAISAQPSLPR